MTLCLSGWDIGLDCDRLPPPGWQVRIVHWPLTPGMFTTGLPHDGGNYPAQENSAE
jgi:hypothetical protein